MCVFDTDGSTVRIAHKAENLAQQHGATTGESTNDKLTIEVPERQPVILDFEVGVGPLLVLQRVDIGHAVAADAICVDQFLHARSFVDLIRDIDLDVLRPTNRNVGDTKCREYVLIKTVLAD